MTLNASRLMPRFNSRYCGIAWYLVNSPCHCFCDKGGSTPVTGFHSTIERPDSVSRVAPPTISVRKIIAAAHSSHSRTAPSRTFEVSDTLVIALLAGDDADHIVLTNI